LRRNDELIYVNAQKPAPDRFGAGFNISANAKGNAAMKCHVKCALLGVALLAAQSASAFSKPPDIAAEYATTYNMNPAHTGAVDFSEAFAPPFKMLWDKSFDVEAGYPLIAEGNVYVVTGEVDLFAYDLATGTQQFEHLLSVWNNEGAYDAGQLFYVNEDGLLVALDAKKGKPQWSVQLPHQSSFDAAPIAVNGRVYITGGGGGGDLYSVDEGTGHIAWDVSGLMTGGIGSPAFGNNGVYYDAGCQFYAFQATTGKALWFDGSLCSSSPSTTAYFAKKVYMITTQGNDVLRAKTGEQIGSFPGDFSPSIFKEGKRSFMLSVDNNETVATVYCTSLGSGNVAWKFDTPNIVWTPPVYAKGYVLVGDFDGNVHVLNAKTGVQVWTTKLSHPVFYIAAGQGAFVVSASDELSPNHSEVAAFAPQ